MRKRCIQCGAEYDGRYDSTLCPACAAASKAASIVRDRTCRACGRIFRGGPRAWYCPECRADRQRKADVEYKRRKAAGRARSIGSEGICEACGKPYTINGSLQRYCPECAPEAVREADRAQSRAWIAANVDVAQRRAARKASKAPIPCVVCGKLFTSYHGRVTCSIECRKARQREAQRRADAKRRHEGSDG